MWLRSRGDERIGGNGKCNRHRTDHVVSFQLFYDNPKDIFENESDTDSETESETALTSELVRSQQVAVRHSVTWRYGFFWQSDDLIELKDSFAAVKLQGRSLYNPKVPLRRAVSLQSGRSGYATHQSYHRITMCTSSYRIPSSFCCCSIHSKSRPILRIKPGLSSALSIAQMEEIKGLGIQDSLILRSMSMPLVGDTHVRHSIWSTVTAKMTRTLLT